MPAAKERNYKASDIMKILGVGKSKAYDIIHECEAYGIVFRDKGTLRIDIDGFNAYYEAHKIRKPDTADILSRIIKEGNEVIQKHRRGRPRKEVCV